MAISELRSRIVINNRVNLIQFCRTVVTLQ